MIGVLLTLNENKVWCKYEGPTFALEVVPSLTINCLMRLMSPNKNKAQHTGHASDLCYFQVGLSCEHNPTV